MVPEAPAETPAPSLAGVEASMPLFPGGAPPSRLDKCGLPYSYVQRLVRNGLANTSTTFGGDSYETPAAAIYARYNKSALYPALERGLQPCTAACNAQYMCGELCLHPSLYLDQHNGGGVETTGAIEWVHAMLLQSRDGVLRLFPWLPEGTKRAEFVRLRTVGAFLVTANWTAVAAGLPGGTASASSAGVATMSESTSTADGGAAVVLGGGMVVSPVTLSSEAGGRCELELFEGWTTTELTVCSLPHNGSGSGGKVVVVEEKDDEGRVLWSFETVKGVEYSLRRGIKTACP